MCLHQMKVLCDRMMNDEKFKEYGYVLKKDLIDVYKKKKHAREQEDDSGEDVLFLI
jgi:hypothetical protein